MPYSAGDAIYFLKVREGLSKLAMKILGPSTIVQAAVPQILQTVPQSFHERNVSLFYVCPNYCIKKLLTLFCIIIEECSVSV